MYKIPTQTTTNTPNTIKSNPKAPPCLYGFFPKFIIICYIFHFWFTCTQKANSVVIVIYILLLEENQYKIDTIEQL